MLDAAPLRGVAGTVDRERTTTTPQFVRARSTVPRSRLATPAGRVE